MSISPSAFGRAMRGQQGNCTRKWTVLAPFRRTNELHIRAMTKHTWKWIPLPDASPPTCFYNNGARSRASTPGKSATSQCTPIETACCYGFRY